MLKEKALTAAKLGLEYFVREQLQKPESADCGRFPFIADCRNNVIQTWTTNWTTGVVVSLLLSAHRAFGDQRYLEAAGRGVSYLRSLQNFTPWQERVFGVLHENTPQTPAAHPRDALTGAWAMLDYSIAAGDEAAGRAARYYADWFVRYGMETGYPYWTVRFDDGDWEPHWFGSFHSGSAFFFYRLAQVTGGQKEYVDTMKRILDFYNENLLGADGNITVIREHGTKADLDLTADPAWAPAGWIAMHKFNDDFGALANLAAWQYTGEDRYREAARRFLDCMARQQKADGGFGPADWQDSIPNAAGVILLEMLTAKRLGAVGGEYDAVMDRTAQYLLNQQYLNPESRFHGAFHGMTGEYRVDRDFCNTRATGYAIMSLLYYATENTFTYKVEKQR